MRGEYRLEAKQHMVPAQAGPHLAFDYVFLPVAAPTDKGQVQLRLHSAVDPALANRMGESKVKPDWQGTIVSNMIALTLRERPNR